MLRLFLPDEPRQEHTQMKQPAFKGYMLTELRELIGTHEVPPVFEISDYPRAR